MTLHVRNVEQLSTYLYIIYTKWTRFMIIIVYQMKHGFGCVLSGATSRINLYRHHMWEVDIVVKPLGYLNAFTQKMHPVD